MNIDWQLIDALTTQINSFLITRSTLSRNSIDSFLTRSTLFLSKKKKCRAPHLYFSFFHAFLHTIGNLLQLNLQYYDNNKRSKFELETWKFEASNIELFASRIYCHKSLASRYTLLVISSIETENVTTFFFFFFCVVSDDIQMSIEKYRQLRTIRARNWEKNN